MLGGIDLAGKESTVEMMEYKGRDGLEYDGIRAVGLDGDDHSAEKGETRELRTFDLQIASYDIDGPTTIDWFIALSQMHHDLRSDAGMSVAAAAAAARTDALLYGAPNQSVDAIGARDAEGDSDGDETREPSSASSDGNGATSGGSEVPSSERMRRRSAFWRSDSCIEPKHRSSLVSEYRKSVVAVEDSSRRKAQVDIDALREVNTNMCCWGLDGKVARIAKSDRVEKLRESYECCRRFVPTALAVCVPYARIGAIFGGALQALIAIAIGLACVVIGIGDAGYGPGIGAIGISAAFVISIVAVMNARAGCSGTHEDRLLALSTVVATVALYLYSYGVAMVAGFPFDAPRHLLADACLEAVWELLPVDVVKSLQDSLGCCGWTYFDPAGVVVEQDIFGRKRSRGNRLPNEGVEGGVECPKRRTSLSCAPLPETNQSSTYTLVPVPASCRAEFQCHVGGTGLPSEAQFVNNIGMPTWNLKSPLFIFVTILTAFQVVAALILMFATRHSEGDDEAEYEEELEELKLRLEEGKDAVAQHKKEMYEKYDENDAILQGATMRLQRIWRGWIERRRHFQRVYYLRWEHLKRWRCIMSACVYTCAVLWGAMMTYVSLLYGVKFSPDQGEW